MPFNKVSIKRQTDVEDGDPIEIIDARLQYEVDPGMSMEEIRAMFHQRLDKRFNEMFAYELGLMAERMEEGERWEQMGLFTEPGQGDVEIARAAVQLKRSGTVVSAARRND